MLWDLSSLIFGQFLSMALGFVGFAYLTRTLSAESYGFVEYAVAIAAIAAVVVEGGMGAIGTLYVSRDRSRAPELAARIPMARLLLAMAVIPLVGLVGTVTTTDPAVRTLIWLFGFSLLSVPLKQDWLLQGLERMTYVAPAQALKSALFAILVMFAVRSPGDIFAVGAAEATAAVMGGLYFLGAQRTLSIPIAIDRRLTGAWELIRTGASVGAANMLWPFMVYAPVLLVANLAGSVEAAWLGAAQRIVIALVSVSGLYFFNMYPLIARTLRDDPAVWGRLMASSYRLIAWIGIGAALAITLFAPVLVTAIFGPDYRVSAPVLATAIWILPIRLLSGHARWSLLAAERQATLLRVELACAATIVAGGVLLIPAYGALGGAIAAVTGNFIGWVLAHLGAHRHMDPLPGVRPALPPTAIALVAGAVGIAAGPSILVSLGALLAYSGCLWAAAPELLSDAVRLAYARNSPAVQDQQG